MAPVPLRQMGYNCYLYAGLLSSEAQGQPFTMDLANSTMIDVMALGKQGGFSTGGKMSSAYRKIKNTDVIGKLGQGKIIAFSPTDEEHAYGVRLGMAPGMVIHLNPANGQLIGADIDPLTQNGIYYEVLNPDLTSPAYTSIVRNFLTSVRVPYMQDEKERMRLLRENIHGNIGLLDKDAVGLTPKEVKYIEILRRSAPK